MQVVHKTARKVMLPCGFVSNCHIFVFMSTYDTDKCVLTLITSAGVKVPTQGTLSAVDTWIPFRQLDMVATS